MRVRSKKPVWFLFKFLELLLSLACCLVHWQCFRHHGVPHIFILCGAYGGSIIICILSLVGSFYAERPTMKHEAAHAGIVGSMHLVSVFVHMYMAQMERFRTGDWAGLYYCCRNNALVALYATAIYMLHLTFALDLLLSHRSMSKMHPDRGKRPLRLYFISPGVEAYVSRFRWYRHLATKMLTSTNVSEHSARSRRLSFDSESDTQRRRSAYNRRSGEFRKSGEFRRSPELKKSY